MAKAVKVKEEGMDILDATLNRLNDLYGVGTVISGNQKSLDIKTVSTGSLKVDIATGVGGLPYGCIVEIYGPESSGKTTMCIHAMVNAQKDLEDTRKVALIDMEHSIQPQYMQALGMNLDDLILSQPPFGEAAMEIANQLIKSGRVKMVVVDSVATLVPKSEMDSGVGDPKMAGLGRLMSQGLRTINPIVEHNNCLLVFTNQLRDTPGVMYGNPSRPTGGNSLKFYASMRIDITKSVGAAEKEREVNKTTVKIIKSKVSKPFQQCTTEILWGIGFNRIGEIIDLGEDYKILQKSGSHYSYNGQKLANGYDAMNDFLNDNPELAAEIEEKVLNAIKGIAEPIEIEEPVKTEA